MTNLLAMSLGQIIKCASGDLGSAVYVQLHGKLTQRNGDYSMAISKVPIGAQDFVEVICYVSRGSSTVHAFAECIRWCVCTMAGHARAHDTPACFRF